MHYVKQPKAEHQATWHTIFSGSKEWKNYYVSSAETIAWITGLPSNIQNFRATGTVYLASMQSGYKADVVFTLADNTTGFNKSHTSTSGKSHTLTNEEFMKIVITSKSYSSTETIRVTYDAAAGTLNLYRSGGGTYGSYIKFTKIEALY